MDNEIVSVSGLLMSMHIFDGAIDKAFRAQEMFENLIGMGLIDEEALEGIGYYEVQDDWSRISTY